MDTQGRRPPSDWGWSPGTERLRDSSKVAQRAAGVCVGGAVLTASSSLPGPTSQADAALWPPARSLWGPGLQVRGGQRPRLSRDRALPRCRRRVPRAAWRWRSRSWRARERTGHCGPVGNARSPPARDPERRDPPCPAASTPNGGPPASLMNERLSESNPTQVTQLLNYGPGIRTQRSGFLRPPARGGCVSLG